MATADVSWLEAAPGRSADVSWLQAAPARIAQVSWLQAAPTGAAAQVSWLEAAPGVAAYTLACLPGIFSVQGAQAVPDYEVDIAPGTFAMAGKTLDFTFVPYIPPVSAAITPRRQLALSNTPRRRAVN